MDNFVVVGGSGFMGSHTADALTNQGHYISTPYRYTPKQAKKLIPSEFIDLGEGILEIVEELHNISNK
jgi:nucleoside-diphosphate-sugar epimerase